MRLLLADGVERGQVCLEVALEGHWARSMLPVLTLPILVRRDLEKELPKQADELGARSGRAVHIAGGHCLLIHPYSVLAACLSCCTVGVPRPILLVESPGQLGIGGKVWDAGTVHNIGCTV